MRQPGQRAVRIPRNPFDRCNARLLVSAIARARLLRARIGTMRIRLIRLGYRQFFWRFQIIWRRNVFMKMPVHK